MLRTLVLVAGVALATLPAAAAEMIHKVSASSVAETMDRLEAAVTKAGATVIARVDHAQGARDAGLELPAAELLIFGNPMLGTPVMQEDIAAGLDLPMRVLVAEDDDGGVHVIYRDPATLAADHEIKPSLEVLGKMAQALDKLTDAAVAD